jgi:hypothetical protein
MSNFEGDCKLLGKSNFVIRHSFIDILHFCLSFIRQLQYISLFRGQTAEADHIDQPTFLYQYSDAPISN